MQLRTLLAIAGLTIAATACGSDSKSTTAPGDDGPGTSSYSASVTGGVARSLSGRAAFTADNQEADVGFGMALVDEDSEEGIIVWRRTAGVLAVGQHTVADYDEVEDSEVPANQLAIMVFMSDGDGLPLFCVSTGGTLTVASSSGSRLRGSFQFTASCASLMNEEVQGVTLTGTFDAAGGAVVIPG